LVQKQRLEMIKSILNEKQIVMLDSLREILGVSDVTIRKDLDKLEDENFLEKIHGGAVLAESKGGTAGKSESIINYEAKRKISQAALKLINQWDSIFLASGSTCFVFSSLLPKNNSISIVTNNINAAMETVPMSTNNILLGGEVYCDANMYYTSGTRAINDLDSLKVNHAILSLDAVDPTFGFTSNFYGNVLIARELSKIAKELILLVDHTKFGKIGIHQMLDLDNFSYLVTDLPLSEEYKQLFDKAQIKVIYPEA
jgi:DeoR/GlpR family transcriptional regulator of sugar metabolism